MLSMRLVSISGSCNLHQRSGCALGNAAAESFFLTLAHERVSRCRYTTRSQARLNIATWIDIWYNKKQLRSTNNTTNPIDYEHAHNH